MNTAVISSIIGTVGAAFIAVLIFYLQGLRDDIRALDTRLGERIGGVDTRLGERIDGVETRLGERIDGVETRLGERIDGVGTRLGEVEKRLIRIEAVQLEHGRKLDGIADHGARISALEGAVTAMS